MNYIAHGIRFLDRPHFLAGTAVPDWLSVADRRVRVRPKLTEPLATGDGSAGAEIAAGILQHLHDDGWFHKTRGFAQVTWELTQRFRELPNGGEEIRAGFLGHVATEMLLDAALMEQHPGVLDDYYAALARVDPGELQRVVNRASRRTTDRLAEWVGIFLSSRFLYDYRESPALLYRLNQVLRRVRLQPLPEAALDVLDAGREIVTGRIDDLLPPERFALAAVVDETRSPTTLRAAPGRR